jgi:hypothetical protein
MPSYRLHHRRAVFDEVVSLSVEGVNKSAISRVKEIPWNTVHRWLERAAACCRRFNHHKTSGLEIPELRTFISGKDRTAWIFTAELFVTATVKKRARCYEERSLTLDVFLRYSHLTRNGVTTAGLNVVSRSQGP